MAATTSRVATIAAGASLSNGVMLSDSAAYSLILPAAWTTANITFQVSIDGTIYGTLYNPDNTEFTVTTTYTAATSGVVRAILLNGLAFFGFRWVKLQSGTGALPVLQTAGALVTIGMNDS